MKPPQPKKENEVKMVNAENGQTKNLPIWAKRVLKWGGNVDDLNSLMKLTRKERQKEIAQLRKFVRKGKV